MIDDSRSKKNMINDQEKKKIASFTDLVVWQKGHELVVGIYQVTKSFPQEETYGLTNQIRRAAVSITSNLAEGFGRQTRKEKVQFYYMAQGSLVEVKNQLLIAKDIKYLHDADFKRLAEMANAVHALLQGLLKKTKEFSKKEDLGFKIQDSRKEKGSQKNPDSNSEKKKRSIDHKS